MSWRFDNWSDELQYRVQIEDDEEYEMGIYDMATNIVVDIENSLGHELENTNDIINIIYGAIKYGKGVE